MNDAELIRRSQAGESEAFELLLERYRTMLTRTAYLTTRDRGSVQDIVQETLVQVWRGLPLYRPYGSFKAWLVKILINQARKQHRRKRVETVPLEEAAEVPGNPDGPEQAMLQKEEAQRLRQALGALTADHRDVLVLRYYSDLTVPEIAKALGCREGTVKSRLSRALSRLEGVLADDPSHATGGAT